jgi:V-type H+-transporting ATPase subunit C
MFKFEVPSLTVGTLDTLMTMSDDLGKTDQLVEQIVRKIEKTTKELSATRGPSDLSVGGVPAARYIQQFAWDSAKYPNRRPLKELVALIAGGASAVEEELKQLTQSYGEKIMALQDAKRRKGGNLLSTELNDVLTEDIMRKVKIVNTDYLKTIFVAVPKAMKDAFEAGYEKIGADLVGYGGPDWTRDPTKLGEPVSFGTNVDRHKVRGSPVVPGSKQLVIADEDSVLYAITILKSQYESGYYENGEFQQGVKVDFEEEFAKALRDKRFLVRDFVWDPTQSSKSAVVGMKSALLRWCKNHYGDAFVAWMHIKVIRVFVESVLRYGLPVDFTAVLYKVHPNKDVDLIKSLDMQLGAAEADDAAEAEGEDEYHDFVMIKFDP